ncbi:MULTISPECIES: O-antigen translocase [unclassified Enterobacter]|uniref:O-antigen translocase n=1 Tax=unclassified Enterobacter TaxID=2608935 RepID=UPI001CBD1421|nr:MULTISPECIES: O-antigen translocase [unclassified Enterobacter]UAN39416.1 O-antigen translocase [Enterobacter sp. JBIWA008]UXP25530.1 O-antigen translocase [Enterobacter sp. 155105]
MKKLLKVTAMTGSLTLLKMLIGFIIAKIVAIYTGPSGMALLGQIQSLVNAFNGVINAPVSNSVIRYTAEHHEDGYEACSPWWRAALFWMLALYIILLPIGLFLDHYLSQWLFGGAEYQWVIYLAVFVLPFTATGTLVNSVINGLQNYKLYVFFGIVSVSVSGAVMTALIIRWNIDGALIAAALQSALIGISLIVMSIKQPWFKFSLWFGNIDKKALADTWGYIVMAIITAIAMPVALMLIRNLLVANEGWAAAGMWQSVWKISEVYLGVCTMALSAYYLPRLSKISDYYSIKHEIWNTAKIIIPIVIIMAITIYLLRDVVITVLFTEQFRNARDLFGIQLMGDVVKIASWLYAFPMIARNATKWFVASEVFFSATLVVMSYYFILHFGIQGANIAYLLNYTLYFIFVVTNLKRISS